MGLLNKKELISSAEVIDKHLILSLPNAAEPVVWRMALDKIGTASFEVKQIKSSESYKLVLKPSKGAAETIAPFDQKEEALQALICASNALQKPEPTAINTQNKRSKKETANDSAPYAGRKKTSKWLYLFIGFAVVIGLYTYMVSLIPEELDFGKTEETSSPSNGGAKTGVPLSADDFLSGL